MNPPAEPSPATASRAGRGTRARARAPFLRPLRWLFLLLGADVAARAASYSVGWSKVAAGGGPGSVGTFTLHGTAGQADAHEARSTDGFTVTGGFWSRPRPSAANRPPVAGNDAIVRFDNALFAKVPAASLLGNDVDPDGDPLTLAGVGDALPAGASVIVQGAWVIYTAPAVNAGAGSFTYTLSDGPGGHQVTGVVSVASAAAPAPESAPNPIAVSAQSGIVSIRFLGVPGYRYRVQYSTDTAPPHAWLEFTPPALHTAPETGAVGVFLHTDANPPEPMRLYRAIPEP